MKDKTARGVISDIAYKLGYRLTFNSGDHKLEADPPRFFTPASTGDVNGRFALVADSLRKLEARAAALEAKFAAQEESAKPVCKSCGQKIQEGLQVGNVEALAAGLKKGGNSKK